MGEGSVCVYVFVCVRACRCVYVCVSVCPSETTRGKINGEYMCLAPLYGVLSQLTINHFHEHTHTHTHKQNSLLEMMVSVRNRWFTRKFVVYLVGIFFLFNGSLPVNRQASGKHVCSPLWGCVFVVFPSHVLFHLLRRNSRVKVQLNPQHQMNGTAPFIITWMVFIFEKSYSYVDFYFM